MVPNNNKLMQGSKMINKLGKTSSAYGVSRGLHVLGLGSPDEKVEGPTGGIGLFPNEISSSDGIGTLASMHLKMKICCCSSFI